MESVPLKLTNLSLKLELVTLSYLVEEHICLKARVEWILQRNVNSFIYKKIILKLNFPIVL